MESRPRTGKEHHLMAERDTLIRSMHDLGAAAWFGGSLMGAVGVNGAADAAKDPTERVRLSSIGWAKWTPWQVAAVGVHAVGGIGLLITNRRRSREQPGAHANNVVKMIVTAAAAGVTAYSGVLGSRVAKHSDEGAAGSVTPGGSSSAELASAQRQLKICQWVIPALSGTIVVLGAIHGEQQRGVAGLLDLGSDEAFHGVKQAVRKVL
jgi:uncharacterized membrane protein